MPLKDLRSICLPYCLDRQPDGGYVALNREYKPIGFRTTGFVTYKDYPVSTKYKGLTKSVAKKLSLSGDEDLKRIYLYNDGCIPTRSAANMTAYMNRLGIFASLKTA